MELSHILGRGWGGLQHGRAHGLIVHPVWHRLDQLRQQRGSSVDELRELVHLHSARALRACDCICAELGQHAAAAQVPPLPKSCN